MTLKLHTKLIISLAFLLIHKHCHSQNLTPSQFNYNCNSVFWTIENGGIIRQWDLVGDSDTGGDAFLTFDGSLSIAFAETESGPTFYVPKVNGIYKYQTNSGWSLMPVHSENLLSPQSSVNIARFKSGIYIIQLRNKEKVMYQRFLKH